MRVAYDEDKDGKWITIHPNGSTKGVHVKVDGRGDIIAGNPHLVEALGTQRASRSHTDAPEDDVCWKFSPPGDEEFGDVFAEYTKPPDSSEFDDILSDDADESKPFSFLSAVSKMSLPMAVKRIVGKVKKYYSSKDELIKGHFHGFHTSAKGWNTGTSKSREYATRCFAATVEFLDSKLKGDAVDFSKIAMIPTKTKHGWASVTTWVGGSHPPVLSLASVAESKIPGGEKVRDWAKTQRELLKKDPNFIVGNVICRYPEEYDDFLCACHEIGHVAYNQRGLKTDWAAAVNKANSDNGFKMYRAVSQYAWIHGSTHKIWSRNLSESHSECFAMMCCPLYKAGTLPKPIEDYFNTNFFK